MKNTMIAVLAFSSMFTLSANAKSKSPVAKEFRVYETIKFQKSTYEVELNLMEDGIQIPEGYEYAGYGIKFNLEAGEEFKITAEVVSDDPKSTAGCGYEQPVITQKSKGIRQVTIDLNADVETDSGEKCQYTIDLNSGKKAIVSIFEEGT
ncbi:MAG: hypothetical protein ACXVA9_13845 [Bdellovibrionales bacterium]